VDAHLIAELLGRWSVSEQARLTPRLRREKAFRASGSHYGRSN
jgi:hypothetical protein